MVIPRYLPPVCGLLLVNCFTGGNTYCSLGCSCFGAFSVFIVQDKDDVYRLKKVNDSTLVR